MITMSQNKPSTTRSRTLQAITLLIALVLSVATPYAEQGTVAPVPRQQFLDNNGDPLASGKLYTYAAGTSTPLATFTDVNLSVANANPIVLDSAGRATIFLTSASYKFELQTSAGVVVWTQDNISSVAPFNVDLDVPGTAGEALTAGNLVYLSSGSGSLTAGRWYKTDADLAYASSGAAQWGIAPASIASGASGSIRISGRVTGLSGLSTGMNHYASGTAGGLTATPPTNALLVGRADSTTTLILGNFQTPIAPRGPPCGRLTLTTGLPVTVSDVTAATTLYYTPAGSCNSIFLYDGTAWSEYAFAELSIAVPATTNQMYDVFAYDNAGVVALELTAWTNDTTRATAVALQNGVQSKTGALTRRYLGSFRTTGVSGQTEDSATKRYVWNYYNRARRFLRVTEATNSWTYTTAAWQQANANAANQVDIVVGVPEVTISLKVMGITNNASTTGQSGVGIGEDSATVLATGVIGGANLQVYTVIHPVHAFLEKMPAVGHHSYKWLEHGSGSSPDTWYGDNGGTVLQSGMSGWTEGD